MVLSFLKTEVASKNGQSRNTLQQWAYKTQNEDKNKPQYNTENKIDE
jgi:hypothetical protein